MPSRSRDHRRPCEHMCGNHYIDIIFAEKPVKKCKMVRCIQRIVQEWTGQGKEGCFMHLQAGLAFRATGNMKMGYMHRMTRCESFKDIVVTGRDGMVDIVLC